MRWRNPLLCGCMAVIYLFFFPIVSYSFAEVQYDIRRWNDTSIPIVDTYLTEDKNCLMICGLQTNDASSIIDQYYHKEHTLNENLQGFIRCYTPEGTLLWEYCPKQDIPQMYEIIGEVQSNNLLIRNSDMDDYFSSIQPQYTYFTLSEGTPLPLPHSYMEVLSSKQFWFLSDGVITYDLVNHGRLRYYTYQGTLLEQCWEKNNIGTFAFCGTGVKDTENGFLLYGAQMEEGTLRSGTVILLNDLGRVCWQYTDQNPISVIYTCEEMNGNILCGGQVPKYNQEKQAVLEPILYWIDGATGKYVGEICNLPENMISISLIQTDDTQKVIFVLGTSSSGVKQLLYSENVLESWNAIELNSEGTVGLVSILHETEGKYSILFSQNYMRSEGFYNCIECVNIDIL